MRSCLLLLAAVPLLTAGAAATSYLVTTDGSGDYPTIQAAIDTAESGDITALADGTFTDPGNRDIGNNGLELTVRSRSGNPVRYGGGIYCESCSPAISNWILGSNRATEKGDGGLYAVGSAPALGGCLFLRNSAPHPGGAVSICTCGSAVAELSRCTFSATRCKGVG